MANCFRAMLVMQSAAGSILPAILPSKPDVGTSGPSGKDWEGKGEHPITIQLRAGLSRQVQYNLQTHDASWTTAHATPSVHSKGRTNGPARSTLASTVTL